MTAWVAVGLIGGGTAFASRLCSLSRLIGAGMIVAGGVVLAAPAFADEHVLAKDNSEVACTMSKAPAKKAGESSSAKASACSGDSAKLSLSAW